MLSWPKPSETLYLYLAVSNTDVTAALIRKEENKELHVYYLAKGFVDAETRYPMLEKLALALVAAAR